jgi:SAM-dependent methyltransferase
MSGEISDQKIGVLVVAYNAASTLAGVLDRIPTDFRHRISEVLVSDDDSQDATYLVGLGYRQLSELPITVIRQPRNLGYGGNQKAGYRLAIERGFDIIVLLHGDGQYAPECLPEMVAPLEDGSCDAVFGSRMMIKGAARRGGMPLYKFVGNRILSTFENAMLGTRLSEHHSGYRAYSVKALQDIPFERNSDGFNFDTQIIIQLHEAGKLIREIPIPTYYGDEICYVDGMRYARDIVEDVTRYRLHKAGFGLGDTVTPSDEYELKGGPDSSHGRVLSLLASRPASKILDLGCSGGQLAARLQQVGHHVTGVDRTEVAGVRDRVASFVRADLDEGLPPEVGCGFDVVLAADVLEHVRDPQRLLHDAKGALRPGGRLVVCVPNIAHWYPRFRTLFGLFDYDQRGILDRTHLRFFTRRSIKGLLEREGFSILREEPIGLPLEVLSSRSGDQPGIARRLDHLLLAAWPTMFAYQFLIEAEPNPT